MCFWWINNCFIKHFIWWSFTNFAFLQNFHPHFLSGICGNDFKSQKIEKSIKIKNDGKIEGSNIRPLFTQPQMQMVLPRNNSLDKNIEIIQTSMNGYQVRKNI